MTVEAEGAPEGVVDDTAAADLATVDTASPEAQPGDGTAAPETEEQAAERRKQTARERVEQAVARQREAERERDYWRNLATSPAQPQPTAQQPQPDPNGEPDPANYEYGEADAGYVRALARYEARQEFERQSTERDQRQRATTQVQSFEQRLAQQFPDGEPDGIAALRQMPKLNGAIQDVILTSEIGPKIADHLGANPAELRRLSALEPHLIGRELGKLEARLETPAAPKAKTATDAPEPSPQVRGAGGRFTIAPDTSDFASFEAQHGSKL